ncbi:MAG: hypothetical protein AB7U75_14640 [Hyphomicrobiaceae bacterium]
MRTVKFTVSATVLEFYSVEVPDDVSEDDLVDFFYEQDSSVLEPYRTESINWEVINTEESING